MTTVLPVGASQSGWLRIVPFNHLICTSELGRRRILGIEKQNGLCCLMHFGVLTGLQRIGNRYRAGTYISQGQSVAAGQYSNTDQNRITTISQLWDARITSSVPISGFEGGTLPYGETAQDWNLPPRVNNLGDYEESDDRNSMANETGIRQLCSSRSQPSEDPMDAVWMAQKVGTNATYWAGALDRLRARSMA